MSVINFLTLVLLFVTVTRALTRMQRQLDRLERRASAPIEHTSSAAPATATVPQSAASVAREAEESSASTRDDFLERLVATQPQEGRSSIRQHGASAQGHTPDPLSVFRRWFMHEWPMKVGALLVLAAVGWAVTYAFVNDIIGPVGRVTLALIFGGALLAYGARRMRVSFTQGSVLLFVGVITVLMAALAGINYNLFPAAVALFAMLLVVAFVAEVGRIFARKMLVVTSFLFAALLPLLMYNALTLHIIFLYLFVLSCGVVASVVRSTWRDLLLMNVLAVLFYTVILGGLYGFEKTAFNILFMALFATLFYCAHVGIVLVSRRTVVSDAFTAAAIGLAFYTWTMMIVPASAQAIVLVFGALVAAWGVYMIRRVPQTLGVSIVYAGVAVALIFAATALVFHGTTLAVFVTIETSMLISAAVWFVHTQLSGVRSAVSTALYHGAFVLYLVPLNMSLPSVSAALSFGTLASVYYTLSDGISHLMVLLAVAAGAFTVAAVVTTVPLGGVIRARTDTFHVVIVRIFAALGALYASIGLWMGAHMLLGDALGTFAALVLYTLVGVVLYIKGGHDDYTPYKAFGSAFLMAVAARLFLVDFWAMAMAAKVVTFFVVGVLFISTAFLARQTSPTAT